MFVDPQVLFRKHSAYVTGAAARVVRCANCSCEYVYVVERTADAQETSFVLSDGTTARRKAASRARRLLAEKLRCAEEVVPCPDCGWYQPAMCGRRRLQLLGRFAAIAGGVLLAFGLVYSGVKRYVDAHPQALMTATIAFGACVLVGVGWILLHDVNGNARSRSEREAGPSKLALRKAVWDEMEHERRQATARIVADAAAYGSPGLGD